MEVNLSKETIAHIDGVIGYLWHGEHAFVPEDGAPFGKAFEHVRGLMRFLTNVGAVDYSVELAELDREEREARETVE